MSQNHSAQAYQEYASAILERLTRQDGRASLVQHSAENQNQSMQIWQIPSWWKIRPQKVFHLMSMPWQAHEDIPTEG